MFNFITQNKRISFFVGVFKNLFAIMVTLYPSYIILRTRELSR